MDVAAAEEGLGAVLADIVRVERISPDSHFFDDLGADSMTMTRFCARVRKRADLPAVSIKDVYRNPTIRSLAVALVPSRAGSAPADVQTGFAEVLAQLLGRDSVPLGSHFFDELGADSMTMTQFCARVRKHPGLPPVSMTDVYRNPSISALAAAVAAPVDQPSANGHAHVDAPPDRPEVVRRGNTLCGALQFFTFAAYACLAGLFVDVGGRWIADATTPLSIYLRAAAAGAVGVFALCAVPIAAKWVLIGRWKPTTIPVWSLGYVRFWIVKTLVIANPVALFFTGTPVFPMYLRALGAKVGRGVIVLTHQIPVCTDLVSIGDNTVIRKDCSLPGYHADRGVIEIGGVHLGRDVYVGEKTVLDIDTSMGDGAQLGHASVLYQGQSVPAGQRWHGSPAQRTDLDYQRVAPARCGRWRRAGFGLFNVLKLLLVYVPLGEALIFMVLAATPALNERGRGWRALDTGQLYLDAVVISAVLFFGFLVVGLLFVAVVPRLLNLCLQPDKVYPLYGLQYGVHRTIARVTNVKLFTWLFGDSSYIIYYLRGIGYELNDVEQTGSNFGTEVHHETPFLSSIGSGTMVADGLSLMNADYSSTSFRLSRTAIGAHSFLGNNIAYPAGGRTGENCLLATKSMVPLDGEIRSGVGLLGSPPFEIPRTVERDRRFDHLRSGTEHRRRLAGKNHYNLRSMALFLVVRWIEVLLLTIVGLAAVAVEIDAGFVAIAAYPIIGAIITPLFFIAVERVFTYHPLQPKICSIYDPYFWWHERLWKVPDNYLNLYNGTPFKAMIWRLLGVRIGRRVFDDGVFITERTLATVGDDAVLNHASKIQCHSQEDGTFKSGPINIGARCTLGVGAFVHYGVTIGADAALAADSFLMKGEEVPAGASWGGNPAEDVSTRRAQAGGVAHARAG